MASLKNFTRLDEADFQLTDIHEGLRATVELLSPQWGEHIEVDMRLGDLPKVEAFPGELNQAFMTLLMNAAEAIESKETVK